MQCANCGATLSAEDLARPDCRYCGAALPTQVRAAERVAVVQQLLADRNGNGIPDALEGLIAGAETGAAGQNPVVITTSAGKATVQRLESEVVIVNGAVQSSTSSTGGTPFPPGSIPVRALTSGSRRRSSVPLAAVLVPVGLALMGLIAAILFALH